MTRRQSVLTTIDLAISLTGILCNPLERFVIKLNRSGNVIEADCEGVVKVEPVSSKTSSRALLNPNSIYNNEKQCTSADVFSYSTHNHVMQAALRANGDSGVRSIRPLPSNRKPQTANRTQVLVH